MKKHFQIGFLGCGRVGTALALALADQGYPVTVVASQTGLSAGSLARRIPRCRAVSPREVAQTADLVFLATPDDALPGVVAALEWRPGQAVVHCSGATSMEVLEPARLAGAEVGGFHPLQTFPSPERCAGIPPGTTFGLEADEPLLGRLADLAWSLGGRWVRLRPEDKALYHASAVLACNHLVALVKVASDLWAEFGMDASQAAAALLPLVRGTVDNLAREGLPRCLTGPISRGDLGTVQRHLAALAETSPDGLETYLQLGRHSVPIALAQGTLSAERAAEITSALEAC